MVEGDGIRRMDEYSWRKINKDTNYVSYNKYSVYFETLLHLHLCIAWNQKGYIGFVFYPKIMSAQFQSHI